MYLTDKYIYIHQNKVGGVYTKDWMIQYLGAKVIKYKHGVARMIPEKYRKTHKIIGAVRNPFPWFLSYFTYHQESGWHQGKTFKEYVLKYEMNPRPILSTMGKKVKKKYPLCRPPATDLPIGLWSYSFINYFSYQAWDILTKWDYDKFKLVYPYAIGDGWEENYTGLYILMRTETLKQDMIRTFGEKYTSRINSFKKRNKSKHGDFHKYYDNEMIDLVNKREGVLMDRLGYSF